MIKVIECINKTDGLLRLPLMQCAVNDYDHDEADDDDCDNSDDDNYGYDDDNGVGQTVAMVHFSVRWNG